MKYNFKNYKVGERRLMNSTDRSSTLNCAKSYCKIRKLDWQFRTLVISGKLYLIRTL